MASVFKLPAVGDTMVEGEIVEWLVDIGDTLELDQPICSVETDKSVVEMTTPYRGTVLALGGEPGDVIEVGQTLIVVGEPGEEIPSSEENPSPRPQPREPLPARPRPPHLPRPIRLLPARSRRCPRPASWLGSGASTWPPWPVPDRGDR